MTTSRTSSWPEFNDLCYGVFEWPTPKPWELRYTVSQYRHPYLRTASHDPILIQGPFRTKAAAKRHVRVLSRKEKSA